MNSTEKRINQFAIGYMVKSALHVNKVFREQVEKYLSETFHQITMTGIRNVKKKCVIALVMFLRTEQTIQRKYLWC